MKIPKIKKENNSIRFLKLKKLKLQNSFEQKKKFSKFIETTQMFMSFYILIN